MSKPHNIKQYIVVYAHTPNTINIYDEMMRKNDFS